MIIVTGGAGFIGSATVWKLNQEGHENILIVDKLGSSEKWKNLRSLKFLDFMDRDLFLKRVTAEDHFLQDETDTIIHMGACSSTTEKNCTYLLENNYEYTKYLAHFCADNFIRFIYASSGATYGGGEFGFSDYEENIEKFIPLNMYGYSKQLFDIYAKKTGLLDKMVGIKFFNVYGPNEYHKGDMASKIFKSYHELKNDGKIKLFKSYDKNWADGASVRDFVYVKDAVEVIYKLIDKPDINGIFNVGTGNERSWNDLANSVIKNYEGNGEIEYIDMPEYLRNQYQYFTKAQVQKLKDMSINISWTSLEDGIEDYVKNYISKNNYLGME